MKRTLTYGTATAAVALALGGASLTLARCTNSSEPVETVYGPPPIEEPDQGDPSSGPNQNQPIETLYGVPPTDDPIQYQPIEDLYGPPVGYDEVDDEATDSEAATEEESDAAPASQASTSS